MKLLKNNLSDSENRKYNTKEKENAMNTELKKLMKL